MKALNKDTQAAITPSDSLQRLKEGNTRFTSTSPAQRDLLQQVSDTSGGQWPHAVVLSCIDSRVPVETIFDQGIGDVFSARVAGNVVSPDITASIEYGCKVAGSRTVVVLGHTGCGAVKTAIQDANSASPLQLGSIRSLLDGIKPSVHAVQTPDKISERTYENKEFFDAVVYKNVALTIENLRNDSPVLKEMEDNKEIKIVGAVYSVSDGKVTFMD
ncbi:carbonic anhydrase [Dokdonia pacifica]|uniref:Carbonic anhydrase n=1 Tax=Dokdonia pacifica TaxID=1627892 RepID=A0A238WMC4_9FLAO|nr:carbonic anhydrase family protein [Dokdonia pacifica]GGG21841.1 carbonic anhydrase [Dokdonia pacifica]SNR46839.1 carbonic anhydrase [Dokdonia pacifica]